MSTFSKAVICFFFSYIVGHNITSFCRYLKGCFSTHKYKLFITCICLFTNLIFWPLSQLDTFISLIRRFILFAFMFSLLVHPLLAHVYMTLREGASLLLSTHIYLTLVGPRDIFVWVTLSLILAVAAFLPFLPVSVYFYKPNDFDLYGHVSDTTVSHQHSPIFCSVCYQNGGYLTRMTYISLFSGYLVDLLQLSLRVK